MSDKPKTTRVRRKDLRGALEDLKLPAADPTAPKEAAPQEAAPREQAAPQKPERAVAPMDRDALEDLANMDAADFAAAFAQAVGGASSTRSLRVGQSVEGTVVRVGKADIFVDVGAKSEASIALSELADADGNPAVAPGDRITANVLSTHGGELRLSRRLTGSAARDMLAQAYEAEIPVEGRVSERNPGGFIIDLGGARGFCPVSQIDRFPGEDLDRFIGQTLSFRVTELRGGEAVVSHRVIQEASAEEQAAHQWATLQVGDEVEGVVRSVQPFGAFVDLGGAEGLVHKSELGWGDVDDPAAVVHRGQQVRVRILEIDAARKRMSLSLKDSARDPWSLLGTEYQIGQVYAATVKRLADFGAFADLAPGLTGLIHIANLSAGHVDHPGDVVKPGQQVSVRILDIDYERKRLDLGLKQASADWEPESGGRRRERGEQPASGGFGTLADLLKDFK